jgi:biopolymer transport protein ExbB
MPGQVKSVETAWNERDDTTSWYARQQRTKILSEISLDAQKHVLLIKTLMAILPLLGLLGTVTGMISVFDVMAFAGTGNARLMASGVSKATIPTMAGLVAALSGLYFATWLEKKARTEVEKVEDLLAHH